MAQDASNYTQFLPVTRLYLKAGEVDEAIRILSTIIERMLAGREESELLEIVNQVLDRNPDHVAALRMLVRIHWWQRDMDALRCRSSVWRSRPKLRSWLMKNVTR